MKRYITTVAASSLLAALTVVAVPAKADIVIYDSYPKQTSGSNTNIENFGGVPGAGGYPGGDAYGNTITFDGTARDLTTVLIGLGDGGGNFGTATLYLYAGANPNGAQLLGSANVNVPSGIDPAISVDFTSQNIVLPDTITFVIRGPNGADGVVTSASGPSIGTGPNSFWFEPTAGTFTANSTWAISDGANNNYMVAQFNATVPDGGTTLALLGLVIAGMAGLRRKLSL